MAYIAGDDSSRPRKVKESPTAHRRCPCVRIALLFVTLVATACTDPRTPPARRGEATPATTPTAVVAITPAVEVPRSPCQGPADPERRATSPDGRTTVFVVVDANRHDETALGPEPHEDLCVSRGNGPATLLLAGRGTEADPPERILASFQDLLFAPDGATLFFTTSAWVTSRAAHAVQLDDGKETYLFDGRVVSPITRGPHAGMYLAAHFRLDPDHPVSSPLYRGRIETWSVVTRAGKTVRRLVDAEAEKLQ